MSSGFGTAELLAVYRRGVFPMAESRDDHDLFIIDPDERGVLPLDAFHIPKRLKRTVRQDPYQVTANQAFTRVIACCAESAAGRETTWINSSIINLYSRLHKEGHAHSIECWKDGYLVGGLYGVSIGGAFFGESMFSTATDASKVALVHLVARLLAGGYRLLDAHFDNSDLEQFGLETIPRAEFQVRLNRALQMNAEFDHASTPYSGAEVLQLITQTS